MISTGRALCYNYGMKIRIAALLLALLVVVSPVFGDVTAEAKAPNFWHEFDITFWQTAPFAVFWTCLVGSQLGPVNWTNALGFAALVSAGNAYLHAKKATADKTPRMNL